MEAAISLENNKILVQLNSSPTQLVIYQLKYFGLNNFNDDGKNFEGNIETTKLVPILNYLDKKQIKANLNTEIKVFLEDLKNKEIAVIEQTDSPVVYISRRVGETEIAQYKLTRFHKVSKSEYCT